MAIDQKEMLIKEGYEGNELFAKFREKQATLRGAEQSSI